jgi:hypothetical protein
MEIEMHTSPAKRGSVVIIETQLSQTDAKFKKTYSSRFDFAKAYKVKKGQLLEYKLPSADRAYGVNLSFQRIYVINDPDKQAAAKKAFDKIIGKYNAFDSVDDVRKLILAELE